MSANNQRDLVLRMAQKYQLEDEIFYELVD